MSAAKQQATVTVYQLKVALRAITPLIWRRLLVTSDTTIAQLHDIVQIAMGWEDLHLHQFRIHGKTYGIYRDGGISFADDPHQVILADFKLRTSERFVYEYDMGDCWQHDIRLEAALPFEPRKRYPVCTDGHGDCPPEDCGGPWGFMDLMAERDSGMALLEVCDDQAFVAQRVLDWYDGGPRPTYDDTEFMAALDRMRDWLDDAPIAFDRRAVNAALRKQRKEPPCTSASN
jgi:Plasmid pRiA4b ORF-3-like protein